MQHVPGYRQMLNVSHGSPMDGSAAGQSGFGYDPNEHMYGPCDPTLCESRHQAMCPFAQPHSVSPKI